VKSLFDSSSAIALALVLALHSLTTLTCPAATTFAHPSVIVPPSVIARHEAIPPSIPQSPNPSIHLFRVYLKDKGAHSFPIDNPKAFLSAAAVERRRRYNLPFDETDLPVSQAYLKRLQNVGARPIVASRWLNTVAVACADSSAAFTIAALNFVDSLKYLYLAPDSTLLSTTPCKEKKKLLKSDETPEENNIYGNALEQIRLVNGDKLHQHGFRGKGVRIAVIDGGFMNVNRLEAFAKTDIIATRNFVHPHRSVFCDDEHGPKVFSCLAANLKGIMTGAAPEASYLLIKSEDESGEFPIEEDLWAAAVEFADSFGVDVISSSLGYFRFDNIDDYYTPDELDGNTAFCSRIASIAALKGHLLVVSAGNEGNSDWRNITFPSDAELVLAVGGCNSKKEHCNFSSYAAAPDERIKPDIVALASGVCVLDAFGHTHFNSGTSFSAPLVAGFLACLKQAFPKLPNADLVKLLKDVSSHSDKPDRYLGYGIPDFEQAFLKLQHNAGK